MVQDSRANLFGASPTYQSILAKAGLVPASKFDLSSLDSVTVAGSPVTPECQAWFYENVKRDAWVAPGSGGTDICSGFVGGVVTLPQYAGEIQARCLGVAVYALNEKGEKRRERGRRNGRRGTHALHADRPVERQELRAADGDLFADFPGLWRQGDFFMVNKRGGCFVLGRSDATLNRHGVRIGTAEIYRSVTGVEGVEDGADRQPGPAGRQVLHAAVREACAGVRA